MLNTPRCAVWADMGMGKTSASLAAVDALNTVHPNRTLVVGSVRIASQVWPDDIKKFGFDLPCATITGSEKERLAAMKKDAAVYTVNYENLPWLVETLKDKWPFRMTIADESSRLKGFRLRGGGQRAGAFARRVFHSPWHAQLTGTPSPNGLIDLWGQAYMLYPDILGATITSFRSRWFVQGYDGKWTIRDGAQAEIEGRMKPFALTLRTEDWFDIKKPVFRTIDVELPGSARELYRRMERELFAEIGDVEVEAATAAAKSMKLLQLANGAVYDAEHDWHEVHDAKIQALDSLRAELNGEPLIVAYHFKSDLARLTAAFPSARELDMDPQTVRDWNAGKISLLLAHPASAGHGLNLQDGGCKLCFFGHDWNLENRLQIVERIGPMRQLQSGHPRAVTVYSLVATDTIDEQVVARLEGKASVQDALKAAMRRADER